jgi:N-methylhydantoinase B
VIVDPVRYEVFAHRLWAIGEEGRIALQRVSASPIVVQGGECMSSFYDAGGRMILACSGHLRFAAATSDAIRKLIEYFDESPGFNEGDQIFNNDPYVAGSHTYDQMVVMPIYWQGKRIAWTAASSHTADTGGVLRGAATEIYHEGVRVIGLKVVEAGRFREDVFRTLVEQCRDPEYVGLDLKSRIAANTVCTRGYLGLVEKFGVEAVTAFGQKMIEDAERMARAKLRRIPDGTWRSRIYGTAVGEKSRAAEPYQVMCTMTKAGDELEIDFTGTSGQMHNDQNSTLPSTVAHVTIALTNQLFWDVPWSDGKMAPVTIRVPEGSLIHCRFPAACGGSPRVGQYIVAAVSECLAKMLYAAGLPGDVNASWQGLWYVGGPSYFYGGKNQHGWPVPQGLYDIHGGGLGATPSRDGVSTGGHPNIPSGGISDVERIEMQYPFTYFARRHLPDGGGFGRWNGGNASERVYRARGSKDLSVDFKPYGGLPHGGFGLFGGHPAGPGGIRTLFEPMDGAGAYPVGAEDLLGLGVARVSVPAGSPHRVMIPEGWWVTDFVQGGGGYGDPLDREPERVSKDVRDGLVTRRSADLVYGVVLSDDLRVDPSATQRRRDAIRAQRRSASRPPEPAATFRSTTWTNAARPHECLEIVRGDAGESAVRCVRCARLLCPADQNYKRFALRRDLDLAELAGRLMPDGKPYIGVFREYSCPGCATALQVDVFCPSLGGDEDVWDIRIAPAA